MPDLKHEDYATWLNILKEINTVYFINEKLAIYRKQPPLHLLTNGIQSVGFGKFCVKMNSFQLLKVHST